MCRNSSAWIILFRKSLAHVALQTSRQTKEIGALQKGADFVKAYALGFDINVSRDVFLLFQRLIG